MLGPGLDSPDLVSQVVDAVLNLLGDDTRLVVDAFALGALPELGGLPAGMGERTVLTPNDQEAARLLGRELADDPDDDIAEIARRFGAVVACGDLVVTPAGDRWRVSAGNSGLATSGSGDVVAGTLGGFLARGAEPAQAACWAKFLHASAGDRLAARVGPLGFLAGEVLDELPTILSELG